ncbi:DNA helicase [Janibacter hoylei PVAS-1]|uniref:DNA helicase n=2 Tax=Janibacter TaxID=53457 RepID=A0A444B9T7_9MICO|nr:DNA helicase [Janibacter hoylei PVAS-1]
MRPTLGVCCDFRNCVSESTPESPSGVGSASVLLPVNSRSPVTVSAATSTNSATASRQPRPELPQAGHVVSVRGSTWAVTEVTTQGLLRSPADETASELQHLVSLQSLDEDRLGEEATVVWELEVGQSIIPDRGLPETLSAETFDDPNTLGAFVDAVRWGAVTSADEHAYQAPYRSGANVEPYQLEPLRRALAAPRTNLLLADDVGLGKTIEAGLVIQELLLRHRARSVIIVCPPSLAVKWQDEMQEKFGLDFTIVNSATLAQTRRTHGLAANPFRLYPRIIVSMAWLPTPRAQRMLRDVYAGVTGASTAKRYAFDMLVVDEAHHVAPASPSGVGGGRGYAVDSKRTIAVRELAGVCEHRLFLSATPHNGHTESFTALLEMIDNRRFARGAKVDQRALEEIKVRRLKSDLPEMGFKKRQVKQIPFTPAKGEEDAFALLTRVLESSAQANGRRRAGDIVALLLKKRFLSSPWAFALTLQHYLAADAGAGWPDDIDEAYYDEVLGTGQSDEEEGHVEQPELTALRQSKGTDPLVSATDDEIDELLAWGESYQHQPDAKLSALVEWLDSICRPDGKHWSNERVVIFTEYSATLRWVMGVLEQRGYGDRVAAIEGSTDTDTREIIRERFTTEPTKEDIRVLVATDAAGEGIDLQDFCHRMVNLDVPFNPSRLEQRIGRIDRYGQTQSPEVFTFAPVATASTYGADLDFLQRIASKVDTIASDLGRVNQVIDSQIQERFHPNRSRTAPSTSDDSSDGVNRALSSNLNLNKELTALSRNYEANKVRMHLTPFASRRVVDTALTVANQPPLKVIDDDLTDAQVFAVPTLGSNWQQALEGLDTRREPGVLRPITFDDSAMTAPDDLDGGGRRRDDLVHVHLGHALMQKASRILRSALTGGSSDLHRVTAVVVDGLPTSCVATVSRLVLVGRGGLRLHEEVFLTGIRLRGHTMAEAKVEELLDTALDSPGLQLASHDVRAGLADEWNGSTSTTSRMRTRLEEAVRQRATQKQSAVTGDLAARAEADEERARGIYAAFRGVLEESVAELSEQIEAQSTMLFADDQQRQRQRDLVKMQARAAELDDEERRELAAIRERYEDVRQFVSTAGVVFALTPEDAVARGGAA